MSLLPATITLYRFDSRASCAMALADHIAGLLRQDLERNNRASLAVSGGSTPDPMFHALSQQVLDWSKVQLTLADDRWLTPDHADSNQGKVERLLLQNEARQAQWLPLWNAAATQEQALTACREQLSSLPDQLTCLVLGIGNDGHTASLFPCSSELPELWQSRENCAFVQPASAPYLRITLTPQRLQASAECILHLNGADKLDTLTKALINNRREEMPISHFLQRPIRIFWAA